MGRECDGLGIVGFNSRAGPKPRHFKRCHFQGSTYVNVNANPGCQTGKSLGSSTLTQPPTVACLLTPRSTPPLRKRTYKHTPACTDNPMPTITLQVGQCGNQLGSTLWDLLQQQQAHSGSSSLVSQEWFGRVSRGTSCLDSGGGTALLRPRCICIDSEAKVVKHWEGQQHQAHAAPAAPTVHMLGKGGGCGNNW